MLHTEYLYIKICIQLLEKKLEWGDLSNWTNSNYLDLSKLIFDKTHISISHATLKRIFGKQKTIKGDYYNPQPETKNALAQYLNFINWADFKNSALIKKELDIIISDLPINEKNAFNKNKKKYYIIFILIILLSIPICLYLTKKNIDYSNIPITLKDKVGNYPFTVIVNYSIPKDIKDSLFINFGDSDNGDLNFLTEEKYYLNPQNNTLTHCYVNPDFYKISLFNKNKKIKDIDGVHVLSNGWKADLTLKNKTNGKYYFIPINIEDSTKNILHIYPEQLKLKEIDFVDGFFTEFRNSMEFPIHADSFTFESKVKNSTKEGGLFCNDIILMMSCTKGDIEFNFIGKGCSRWINIIIGDTRLNGINNDLSAFCKDVTDWHIIKLSIFNNTATIFWDNEEISKINYTNKLGNLRCINYAFKGCGSIDFIKLYDSKNKLILENNFD